MMEPKAFLIITARYVVIPVVFVTLMLIAWHFAGPEGKR